MTEINEKKILVIKLGAFGDFIQALGLMRAIRNYHPDANITLMTTKPFEKMALDSGYVDSVIIDDRPKFYELSKWLKLRKTLISEKFDRVYDLQNNDRTGLYFSLIPKALKPEWVGAVKGASHRNASKDRSKKHSFEAHKDTLALAGISGIEVDDLSWMKSDISSFDVPEKNAVLLVPGCSPKRPEKRWSAESYGKFACALVEKGYVPVLIGTQAEAKETGIIKAACDAAIDLTGKTSIYDIAVLAHRASLAVGNDTGPVHVIGVTGCKTLVLFSRFSNPDKHLSLGKSVTFIAKENLDELEPSEVLTKIEELSWL